MRNFKESIIYTAILSLQLLATSAAYAAISIKKLGSSANPDGAFKVDYQNFLIEGTIESGDLDSIKSQIAGSPEGHFTRVQLNVSGGNFQESVEIALYLHSRYVATYVGPKHQCLSACAVIFMAGSQHVGDGYRKLDRVLDVSGILGFHAPFIAADSPENIPEPILRRTYGNALRTANQFLRLSATIDWPNSLTRALLDVPPKEFVYADTVDKLGRWRIASTGYDDTTAINQASAYIACKNHWRWRNDLSAFAKPEGMLSDVYSELSTATKNSDGSWSFSFPNDYGPGCTVVSGGNSNTIQFDVEPGVKKFAAWEALPGDTLISTILTLLPQLALKAKKFSESAFAKSGVEMSRWNHNGSTMEIEFNALGQQQKLLIRYQSPKPSMEREGAKNGALLFDGIVQGALVIGDARIFRAGCESLKYQVTGNYRVGTKTKITLTGAAPKWANKEGCAQNGFAAHGHGAGKLEFDFIGEAVP